MNPKAIASTIAFRFLACAVMLGTMSDPGFAGGSPEPLLKEIIIGYNQRVYGESLQDGSYRGEEGLLRIGPESARSLGLNVLIDQDYLEGRDLFQKADKHLEKAKSAMLSKRREKSSNEHAIQVADSYLSYKKSLELARQKMMVYRSKLSPQVDDRLNDAVTSQLLEKLFPESLRKCGNRLRDGLAHFYNECHGVGNATGYPLSPENVGFVNEVFRQFQFRAPEELLARFDLERETGKENRTVSKNWRQVLEKSDLTYFETVCTVLEKIIPNNRSVDPLLFLALIKRESSFDPLAVSRVGAAGLTQIMPQTALDLGMRNIYKPGYFEKVFEIQDKERKKRTEAMAALARITPEDGLKSSLEARELMQEAVAFTQEKEKIFARYKSDLVQNREDDRFKPAKAIEYGLLYFSRLLQEQDGDVSLALAAYNAGPHRVREYKGIPPYSETIQFRNKVSEYYKEYLKRAERLTNTGS